MTAGSSVNRSYNSQNPTLEPSTEWIGQQVAEKFARYGPAAITWRHRSRDQWPLDSPSYRWSIVTMRLSCTVMEI